MLCLSVRNLKSIVGDFVMGKDHIDIGDFCIPKSQILTICNKTVYYWQYTVIGEVADVKQEGGVPLYVTTNGVKVYAFDPTSICLTSVEPARLGIQAQDSANIESKATEMTTAAAVAASAPIVAQAAKSQEDEDDFLEDDEPQSSDDDDEFSIDDVDDELDSTPTEETSQDDDDDEFDLDSLDDEETGSSNDDEDDEDDFFEDDSNEQDDEEDEFDLDDFDDLEDESSKDDDDGFDI